MRVVLAIPTIAARPGLAERTAAVWAERTPEAEVVPMVTTAGSSWAAGLNDVAERAELEPTDLLVCGSDDMVPADERWLPTVLPWLSDDLYPAPTVEDPRFVNHGGHPVRVPDGTRSEMSTLPILRADWLDIVFPLPDDLHYFSDNLLALKLRRAGIRCVAVTSCRILHLHASEGRGCGYGNENTRLHVDTVRYTRELDALGIDRAALPDGLRGGLWEPRFLEVGRALGA